MKQSTPIFRPFSKNILAKLKQEPQQLKTVDQRSFLKQAAARLSPAWQLLLLSRNKQPAIQ